MPYLIAGGAEAFKKDTKKNLGLGVKVSGSTLKPIYEALQHYEAVLAMSDEEKCKAVCSVLSKSNNWYIKKEQKMQSKSKKTKTVADRSRIVGAVLNEAITVLRNYDPTLYRAVQNYHIRKRNVKKDGGPQTKTMAQGYVNERVSYLTFNKGSSIAAGFVDEGFTKDPATFPVNSNRRAFQGSFQETFGHTDFKNLTPMDWQAIHQMASTLDQQKISVRYMTKFERMEYMLEGDGNGGLRFVRGARSAQGDGWPYAMDEWGSIYTANNRNEGNKAGKRYFNHSTFTSGDVVVCAGELDIDAQGRLLTINNGSGHYQPTADHLRTMLTILRDDYQVDLAGTKVTVVIDTNHAQEWNSGDRFLAGAVADANL